jgi:hypothetical protein
MHRETGVRGIEMEGIYCTSTKSVLSWVEGEEGRGNGRIGGFRENTLLATSLLFCLVNFFRKSNLGRFYFY